MKTRFSAIIASLLLFLAVSSCGRQKGMFVLQGTVHDDTDSILVVGLDNRFPYVDTISCRDGLFKWSFRPDTVTTLILILPDGRQYPVFAEKDVRSEILKFDFKVEYKNSTSVEELTEQMLKLVAKDQLCEVDQKESPSETGNTGDE